MADCLSAAPAALGRDVLDRLAALLRCQVRNPAARYGVLRGNVLDALAGECAPEADPLDAERAIAVIDQGWAGFGCQVSGLPHSAGQRGCGICRMALAVRFCDLLEANHEQRLIVVRGLVAEKFSDIGKDALADAGGGILPHALHGLKT